MCCPSLREIQSENEEFSWCSWVFGNSVLICNLLEFPGLVDVGWIGVRSVEFIVLTSWACLDIGVTDEWLRLDSCDGGWSAVLHNIPSNSLEFCGIEMTRGLVTGKGYGWIAWLSISWTRHGLRKILKGLR
ncbi:hypothetical protein Droror1_Dr00023669 [Drosera rotundifolia]